MEKILVAIDTAREGGNDALVKTAQRIASAMGGSLILFHVIEQVPGYALAQIPLEVLAKRQKDVEKEIKDLAAQYGISNTAICTGAPAAEILDYAAKINADLIVLDSHDPGLSDYFIGSVASRVVRHAHCSVHILRHRQ